MCTTQALKSLIRQNFPGNPVLATHLADQREGQGGGEKDGWTKGRQRQKEIKRKESGKRADLLNFTQNAVSDHWDASGVS
jgi:hypothetical protein